MLYKPGKSPKTFDSIDQLAISRLALEKELEELLAAIALFRNEHMI